MKRIVMKTGIFSTESYWEIEMEDLREVGKKAIETINKLKPADAGDLVLGIGEIIEELRTEPEQFREKLDHLEGLFREFTYSESYGLRNDRTVEPEDAYIKSPLFGVIASGMVNINNNIPLSGALSGSYSKRLNKIRTRQGY